MALVGYSDSEGSDNESPNIAPVKAKPASRAPKPAFQKVVDLSGARKIKVDLPTVKPEVMEEERPAKKARTGGFGGFNSFLPAPKRTAEAKKPGLGLGVSLRTGAEPAFSRESIEPDLPIFSELKDETSERVSGLPAVPVEDEKPKEVKMVGNAMRFKPLSVANKKEKKKSTNLSSQSASPAPPVAQAQAQPLEQQIHVAPPSKKKVSLFSVTQEEEASVPVEPVTEYQPILADPIPENSQDNFASTSYVQPPTQNNPNSLDAIAGDLNLSAAERRQLFGRNKGGAAAPTILHFDMEAEYAHNEQLRQQGQAQDHRAVKAIAPGKHSLQQLVNAASTQKEALEDKWAEGKRNKAEGGGRYGW
ncbi:mitotic checkpoint regulator, MAD2B-interacting-domain-containing protein [Delphinella strobiligena]|nr:mitotic checkpoint regulator, MAD2B-interacting-domain-containing protein [Delphinella strobiligena]